MTLTTLTPPADATFLPKLAQMPEYAMNTARSIGAVNDDLNSQAQENFSTACKVWLQSVLNHGLVAAGPKPVAPLAIVTLVNTDFDPQAVYVWSRPGDPVGICPDPPTNGAMVQGSIVSKAPPSQLDLIQAMLQQVLVNQAKAGK